MTAGRLVDVRELAAPEPLRLVLQSLDDLPTEDYVHVIHRREPHCLLGTITELGFSSHIRRVSAERVDIWLWRRDDARAELAARRAAEPLA